MRSGITLREDFNGAGLRLLARQTKDAAQARRLLALARSMTEARDPMRPISGNVTLQIVRDWVLRFNENGPQGPINVKSPGQQSRLNDQQRTALAQAMERGPTPYFDGIVRSGLCDLAQCLREEVRVSVSEQTLSRQVRAMGNRKLTARPKHHAQNQQAIEDFKRSFSAAVAEIAAGAAEGKWIEIWFEDQAHIRQKNKITRRWAERGIRPQHPTIRARVQPTFSVQSARRPLPRRLAETLKSAMAYPVHRSPQMGP